MHVHIETSNPKQLPVSKVSTKERQGKRTFFLFFFTAGQILLIKYIWKWYRRGHSQLFYDILHYVVQLNQSHGWIGIRGGGLICNLMGYAP